MNENKKITSDTSLPYSNDPERWKETHNLFLEYLKSNEKDFERQGSELLAKATLIREFISKLESTYYKAGLTK